VGLLLIGTRRQCTGALVRPDVVLTAAHCVFDEEGAPAEASSLRFLAGWRHGRALAEGAVVEVLTAAGYDPLGPIGGNTAHDVALLRLAAPIRHPQVSPLALGAPPRSGDRVAVVSYASGRTDAPALEADCGVLDARGASVTMDCLSAPGASGSPILTLSQGRPAVVSVISGGATWRGRKVTIAAGVGPELAGLMAAIGPPARPFGREGARGAGGAKFLSP
jgi:V8-like Glu-specific endopeptidase